MWFMILFAAFALFMPLVMSQLSGTSGSGDQLFAESFASQHPVIHGKEIPASSLRVVHRWPTNATSGRGGPVEMDANWLCRTQDGLFVVAIGQIWRDMSKVGIFSNVPTEIRWIWRSISEQRAKQLLAATPGAYRDVFGTDPDDPTRPKD